MSRTQDIHTQDIRNGNAFCGPTFCGRACSRFIVALGLVSAAACGSTTSTKVSSSSSRGASVSSIKSTIAAPGTTSAAPGAATKSGFEQAKWSSGVTISFSDGTITFKSNGIPNHLRQQQYALPNAGVRIPSASTAYAADDPTVAQTYQFTITTNPKKASTTTSASLGTIGVMISGAALFNPYEGDGATVATSSNFTVKDAVGKDVAFLDSCSGHPTPMGQYHYHALPSCITATIDTSDGPSHILGIAFDGFPIYGDHDISGKIITAGQLDSCNGINSATPEFPKGTYHYVLLNTTDASSSIKCFSGTVDASLVHLMPGMP